MRLGVRATSYILVVEQHPVIINQGRVVAEQLPVIMDQGRVRVVAKQPPINWVEVGWWRSDPGNG